MSQPELASVGARTSLRDEAIQTLYAAIIAGILRPGAAITSDADSIGRSPSFRMGPSRSNALYKLT